MKYAYRLGLQEGMRGNASPVSILKEKDIPTIRQRYLNGETQISIGMDYGVHKGTIQAVCSGRSWGYIL